MSDMGEYLPNRLLVVCNRRLTLALVFPPRRYTPWCEMAALSSAGGSVFLRLFFLVVVAALFQFDAPGGPLRK